METEEVRLDGASIRKQKAMILISCIYSSRILHSKKKIIQFHSILKSYFNKRAVCNLSRSVFWYETRIYQSFFHVKIGSGTILNSVHVVTSIDIIVP